MGKTFETWVDFLVAKGKNISLSINEEGKFINIFDDLIKLTICLFEYLP